MARAETTVTVELLRGLKEGSVIEAGLVAPGLCQEKFAFELVKIKSNGTLFEFDAYGFDVFMFTAFAKIGKGEKILWELEA